MNVKLLQALKDILSITEFWADPTGSNEDRHQLPATVMEVRRIATEAIEAERREKEGGK